MRSDRGNAPAEFVLVSALLTTMVLALLQVLLLTHVRHTLTVAAAEGARLAGLIDASPSFALAHTRDLIETSLSASYAQDIQIDRSFDLGVPTTVVTIRAPFPALGLWSVGGEMTVFAHAPLEYVR